MAAKNKMSRKELLESDPMVAFFEKVKAYALDNIRQIAAIGLTLCIIIGGAGLWMTMKTRAENKSQLLFYSALTEMLQQTKNAVDTELKYNRAVEKFKNTSKEYPNTSAGILSLLYAGNCSYYLKKHDDATQYYHKFLTKSEGYLDYLKPYAFEGLGYVSEEKAEYEKAVEWFTKQKSEAGSSGEAMALLNLGRCYETLGKKVLACQSYKSFSELNPSSAFNEIVTLKTGVLCNANVN